MNDTPPKRAKRIGLVLPFAIVGVALAIWSVWWFVVAVRIEHETDLAADGLRKAGYTVSWSGRQITGWPFRTYVRFDEFRIAEPDGHKLYAPELGAEAETFALGKWVVVAPKDLIFTRGAKGDLRIYGSAIRASFSDVASMPPRVSVQLLKPTFAPANGAEPFPLASADVIELHLERDPNDAAVGRLVFGVEGGRARPNGMLDWIAGGAPFSTAWSARLSHMDALKGSSWPEAARNWSTHGGEVLELKAEAKAGDAGVTAQSPRLTLGPDGRLLGEANLELTQGPAALMALGRSGAVEQGPAAAAAAATAVGGVLNGGKAKVKLVFEPGASRLGPVKLAPAPKIF